MTTLTVRKNQNLSSLVKQYNRTHKNKVTVAQVARQNRIKDPDKIHAGQKLKIADGFDSTRTRTQPKTQPRTQPTTKVDETKANQERNNNSMLNIKNQPTRQSRDVFETPAILKGTRYEYKPQNIFTQQ